MDLPHGIYRIFRSINRTFYSEICPKFSMCDLYCGCEIKWALPSIAYPRVVRVMAGRKRSSYTAVFKLNTPKNTAIAVNKGQKASTWRPEQLCHRGVADVRVNRVTIQIHV